MEMKDKNGGKFKFSLKDIGVPRLIMLAMAGILIILLSVPGIFSSVGSDDGDSKENDTKVIQKDSNMTSHSSNTYISEMEKRLEKILGKVSGIGDVEVMITLKASAEQVPLKDDPTTQESVNEVDGEGGSRTNNNITREESTVLVTNENGKSQPYIIQELEPEVEGVLVIAEGGDDAKIKMDIMEAAQVLFGIPAHKVKVMKMNQANN
ncbi:MAG TPA: stage III sporulation protein AG [Clostridiales bacterium]|nr:stage III sporulation protein AG [Clostridiales bacterium]